MRMYGHLFCGCATPPGNGSSGLPTVIPYSLPVRSNLPYTGQYRHSLLTKLPSAAVASARNVVFTTTSEFFREPPTRQPWLTDDVVGWYTIPLSYTVCDSSKLATYAKRAASAAGLNLSAYKGYVYAFSNSACAWRGLGSVGGNPSQAWGNGSFQLKVVSHEMGHNLGLYHSQSLDRGTHYTSSAV